LPDFEIDLGDFPYDLNNLLHSISASVTTIAGEACPAVAKIIKRSDMGIDEVADLNIVANACAIARRVVVAVYFHEPPPA
jgi:hypothetical protein